MVKKGYKQTEEHKRKRLEKIKGHKPINYWLNKKRDKLTKKKISNTLRKRYKNGEIGLSSSCWKKGNIPHNKGIVGWYAGKLASNWRGGKNFEPYSIDWTKTLRKSIRERDKYICQICRKNPVIQIHHIDYNKKNNNPNNLICLCHSCHSKTNFKRKYWIEFFNKYKGVIGNDT